MIFSIFEFVHVFQMCMNKCLYYFIFFDQYELFKKNLVQIFKNFCRMKIFYKHIGDNSNRLFVFELHLTTNLVDSFFLLFLYLIVTHITCTYCTYINILLFELLRFISSKSYKLKLMFSYCTIFWYFATNKYIYIVFTI